jgi:hypothetical protein
VLGAVFEVEFDYYVVCWCWKWRLAAKMRARKTKWSKKVNRVLKQLQHRLDVVANDIDIYSDSRAS